VDINGFKMNYILYKLRGSRTILRGAGVKFPLPIHHSQEGIQNALENIYGQSVSQGNLNVNQVRKYIFLIPALEEQKEIVKIENELMGLCEDLKEKIKKQSPRSEKVFNEVDPFVKTTKH
jgi:restriction endonuclease S subunit